MPLQTMSTVRFTVGFCDFVPPQNKEPPKNVDGFKMNNMDVPIPKGHFLVLWLVLRSVYDILIYSLHADTFFWTISRYRVVGLIPDFQSMEAHCSSCGFVSLWKSGASTKTIAPMPQQ